MKQVRRTAFSRLILVVFAMLAFLLLACNSSAQSTPEPVVTPESLTAETNQPTETPPGPTATLDLTLPGRIRSALGDNDRRDVEPSSSVDQSMDVISVQWAIDSGWNDASTFQGARMDAAAILRAVHESGEDFDLLNLVGTYSLQDQFGNVTEDAVVWLTYSPEALGRINWADGDFVAYSLRNTVYEIADASKFHPAFTEP